MDPRFYIQSIKINGMSASSVFTVGTNLLIGFTSNSKVTNGMGSPSGDGVCMSTLVSSIDDRDQLDMPFREMRGAEPSPSAFGPTNARER